MAVLAAIGLGVQAAGMVGSFLQAGQQQKEINKANAAAQKAMAEAKKQIEVMPFEALTVSDTPYEAQRERFAQQAAQATTAATEMGAAGMGRVGAIAMAADEAQGEIRDQKIQKLEGIEKVQAQDEARKQQQLASLSLQEAEGAQKAAADAQTQKAASLTAGFEGLTGLTETITQVNPLTGEALFPGMGLYGKAKTDPVTTDPNPWTANTNPNP
tara:strand:- start:1449 stop:2090 length:642 start_codon:yes stop_codon:yes gene_type:complete